MNKITKLDHRVVLNQFNYLTINYVFEGNDFSIISRHNLGDDVYRATTTVTMNDEDTKKVEEILSEIKPEPMDFDDSQKPIALQSNITFDCNGEEVSVSYFNNLKINNVVDKVMRFAEENYEDEVMSHGDQIDCIFRGNPNEMDGIVKEQSNTLSNR